MTDTPRSRLGLRSLRFRLPLILMIYCGVVGLVLYTVANELQESNFERDFEVEELVRATDLQSRTERAAERSELETGQREFGELAVFEEIRAAVFVSPDDRVVLSSRHDWIGRVLDLAATGLPAAEPPFVEAAMRRARAEMQTQVRFSDDRNFLTLVLPAAVPINPGELGINRGALILLVYDLRLSKAVNRLRLQRQFAVGTVAVFLAVVGLGISLQVLVTRRIERLHAAMERFARGEPVAEEGGPRGQDEIAELHNHFNTIAATVHREIGVRRQAEDLLRDSEERFRSAMYHSPIGMALVAPSGAYLEVNPALCAIVGYSAGELLGKTFRDITHPEDIRADNVAMERMLRREIETIRAVKRYLTRDGRTRWVQVNSSPVFDDAGVPRYFVTQIQDITERKRADEDLQRANRALRTISNCNQVLVHAGEESELLREVCRVIVRDGGYRMAWVGLPEAGEPLRAPAAVATDVDEDALEADWPALARGRTAEALRTGAPAICDDLLEADVPEASRVEALRLGYRSCVALPLVEGGRVFGVLTIFAGEGVAFDLAEAALLKELADDLAYGIAALRTRKNQQQAEHALLEANERYARQEAALTTLARSYVSAPDDVADIVHGITEAVASTLSVALVGVWRHDESGGTIRCEDRFKWPEGVHSAGITLTADSCPNYFRALAAADVIAATDALQDPRTADLARALLQPDGVTSMMAVPIRSRGVTVGVLSCKHVGAPRRWMADEQTFALAVANLLSALIAQADRQRLEQQLRQAQKLEAIGQLAGGVAHDFNNILTVVLGRAEEIVDDPRIPGDLRDAAAEISQNAERATALTRQLLAFSRRQAMDVRDVDLNATVANVTRLLGRILGEDVVVSFTYSDRPVTVRADPGMLEQILLNLAVNARDAMPSGGRLSISTSIVDVADGSTQRPAGRWVKMSVADTGTGIARENLAHIFEPFFTTKDVGKGTGLGLATTYGIVQQHGGWIEVDSEIGRGTEFRVFLPIVEAIPSTAAAPSAQPPPRGRETILVVEDEPGVRALVIKVLEELGYRLHQAQSGPHALELWREHGAAVDLLITDIVMPDGMNGVELAERLRRSQPGLKVIYMSGYLADLNRQDISRHEADGYISKPFSLVELARLVRQTLDAGP